MKQLNDRIPRLVFCSIFCSLLVLLMDGPTRG
jgi:hypothetical protein